MDDRTGSFAFVMRGKNRRAVLASLAQSKEPSISLELEKRTGMYKSHMARCFKELVDIGVVECLNPRDRRIKLYRVTPLGKQVYKRMKPLL